MSTKTWRIFASNRSAFATHRNAVRRVSAFSPSSPYRINVSIPCTIIRGLFRTITRINGVHSGNRSGLRSRGSCRANVAAEGFERALSRRLGYDQVTEKISGILTRRGKGLVAEVFLESLQQLRDLLELFCGWLATGLANQRSSGQGGGHTRSLQLAGLHFERFKERRQVLEGMTRSIQARSRAKGSVCSWTGIVGSPHAKLAQKERLSQSDCVDGLTGRTKKDGEDEDHRLERGKDPT